jgi:hypothetical protein
MKLLQTVADHYLNPQQVQAFAIREDTETGRFVVEATLAGWADRQVIRRSFNSYVEAAAWLDAL